MSTTMNTTNTVLSEPTHLKSAALEASNLKRVQELVAEFQAGNPEGYLAGVDDNIRGSILGGLIPGAHEVKNKAEFMELMTKMPEYMDVKKFEPKNWRAVGDDVLFNVDWQFTYLPTGKEIETTALVRKVVRNNLICEKYHMVDCEAITGEKGPHDEANVKRVQHLLSEFQAGRPEGYMAGVADDVKASMLGGLIPGAEAITNKGEFGAVMGKMGDYMEVEKFEPCNFRALPNNDMMFNVNWRFKWLASGATVETTAVVRKVLCEGQICEKYHMIDVEAVKSNSPRDVIDPAVAGA